MIYNKRFDKVLGIKGRDLIPKCTTNSVPEAILKQSRDQDHCVTMPGGALGHEYVGHPKNSPIYGAWLQVQLSLVMVGVAWCPHLGSHEDPGFECGGVRQ